ncbi:hypothetical protein [Sandaracinus amylolyticus]|uniref:hypothetical protein n=1 Tax=Sandaracinus amylolyticus TaxID=927083 RepID=UPI001F3D7C49|nr:hypothetical protein [Sandaracinus amylolyticus]
MVAMRSFALALVIGIAGCGGAQRGAAPARARFVVTPDTARVYTDERFLGTGRVLDARPFETRPGTRRFTITADGYFPHDLEVDLPSGTTTIELRLRPVPP